MNPYYVFKEAMQAVRSNALRSALTIIGIVVGIFSVTAMLALGEGLSGNINDRFSSLISGDLTVTGDLTITDLTWIQSQPYVATAYGTQNIQNVTTIAAGEEFSPSIVIALGQYEEMQDFELVAGELFDFTSEATLDRVVVVDEGLTERVSEETGRTLAVGDEITLNRQKFTVIGISEGGGGGFGRRNDGSVRIPFASAIGVVTNTKHFSTISVDVVNQDYYEIAGQALLEGLNASRYAPEDSDDYFSISSSQDAIEATQETTQSISLFLGIVGGIALFVGGIGTMNMMLTTVTERTKEIGLRKAIGARDRDILLQILAESVMLTLIGGLIGVAITYGLAYVANQVLSTVEGGLASIISIQMSSSVVFTATFVAFVVGVVFGIYPARNASKLQPVDALRSD